MNSVKSSNVRGMVQHISNKLPNAPTSLAYVASSAAINSVNVTFTAPTNVSIISYSSSSDTGSGTPSNLMNIHCNNNK